MEVLSGMRRMLRWPVELLALMGQSTQSTRVGKSVALK